MGCEAREGEGGGEDRRGGVWMKASNLKHILWRVEAGIPQVYSFTLPYSRLSLFPRKDPMDMSGIPAFTGTSMGYIA